MTGSTFGARRPRWLDRAVIAMTSRLPQNWLGLRMAIGLRRIVTTHLRSDDGLDVVRWGLRMRLHPRRNGCEKNALFTPQMYETLERAELTVAIQKAKAACRPFVFLDLGANVGLFSLFVAACAGPDARILAVEPEPQNLQRLRFNIAANGELPIRVLPVALGATRGRVALDIDERDRGGTRTRPLSDLEHHHLNGGGHGLVECCSLLELLKQEGVSHVDALKIDVEGAEDRVLVPFFRDAPETLWPELMIIEDSRECWHTDLFAVLAGCSYRVTLTTRLNVALRRVRS